MAYDIGCDCDNILGNWEYLNWLCQRINLPKRYFEDHYDVIMQLSVMPFVPILDLDENRVVDALNLRATFFGKSGPKVGQNDKKWAITFLEMMIGLSLRCEEQIMDEMDGENRAYKWFIDMMDTSKLGRASCREEVDDIVSRINDRNYTKNGVGGLFVVKNPPKDMRKTDLWYQLNWHLREIS